MIARNLGASARNDYAMLERTGGECAGAVTFPPQVERHCPTDITDIASCRIYAPDRVKSV